MSDSVPYPVTSVQHTCLHHNDKHKSGTVVSTLFLQCHQYYHCTTASNWPPLREQKHLDLQWQQPSHHTITNHCQNKFLSCIFGVQPPSSGEIKPNLKQPSNCKKILPDFPGRILRLLRSEPFPLDPPDNLKMQIMRGIGVDNKFQ